MAKPKIMAKRSVPGVGSTIYVPSGTGVMGGKATVRAVSYNGGQKAHFVWTNQTGNWNWKWEGSLCLDQANLAKHWKDTWAKEDPDDEFQF